MAKARTRTGAPALLGGALLLSLLAAAGPATAAVITSCNAMITAPGTYVLVNDLTCPTRNGINVFASNVRLVLGGHTITSTGFGQEEGILVRPFTEGSSPLTGVSIVGGTVTGFAFGMDVFLTSGTRIIGVTVSGSRGGGMIVQNCADCQIVGNRVSGTPGSFAGIYLYVVSGAQVSGNTVTGNGGVGIQANQGSVGNRLTGNVATGNGTDLADFNAVTAAGCANTWNGNTFETKAGGGAACIQ